MVEIGVGALLLGWLTGVLMGGQMDPAKLKELEEKAKAAQAMVETLQAQVSAFEIKLNAKENEVEYMKSVVGFLQIERDDSKKRIVALEKENQLLRDTRNSLSVENDALLSDRKKLEEQYAVSLFTIESQGQRLADQDLLVRRGHATALKLLAEQARSRALAKEIRLKQNALASRDKEIHALRTEREDLKARITEAEKNLASLSKLLDDAMSQNANKNRLMLALALLALIAAVLGYAWGLHATRKRRTSHLPPDFRPGIKTGS